MGIYMRFPEGKAKALTLSYDDGTKQDKKLIEIMNKYGIKGTFNLNGGLFATPENNEDINNRMTVDEALEVYKNCGQEVAIHGLYHETMQANPVPLMMYETIKERERLEEMFGTIVRGMAYPYGGYSKKLIEGLKTAGIVYSRTVASTGKFNIPVEGGDEWFELTSTCHHNDPNLMKYADTFINDTPDRFPEIFYVWGHSYEFDIHQNWNVIESFFEKIANKDDVWYATNIQIYDYFVAYDRLQFSVAFTRVHNPSAISVWLEHNGKICEVKPGETLELPKE